MFFKPEILFLLSLLITITVFIITALNLSALGELLMSVMTTMEEYWILNLLNNDAILTS